MSSYNCDLCDIIKMFGGVQKFKNNNVRVFVETAHGENEIEYDDEFDLLPYYSFISRPGTKNKEIHLLNKSYMDSGTFWDFNSRFKARKQNE